jgi:anti-sigma-K factor RskA
MIHDDYREMIPARALSALDAAEDRVLTNHLDECAECRRELDDWQATTAGLAFEASPLEPSPLVRERILGQVRSAKVEAPSSKVIPFVQPRKNVWSSFGSLGAIAASILFVGMLVYVVLLWKENRALHSQLATLSTENIEARKRLELNAAAMKLISSPGSKMMELGPTPMAPSATAKIAFDKTGHAMLMAQGLPAAPADKEYQLWFIVGNDKMAGKTFTTDGSGNGVLIDQVPAAAMNSAVFAITVEPKGGSTLPTGQIYLVSRS